MTPLDHPGTALPAGGRLLVRHVHSRIDGRGGPNGYLWNLRAAVERQGMPEDVRFEFLEIPAPPPAAPRPPARPFLARMRASLRYRTARLVKSPTEIRFEDDYAHFRADYARIDRAAAERLFACDLLCVHDVCLAERLLRLHPQASSRKLLLMTHSPAPNVEEYAAHAYPDVELSSFPPALHWNRRDARTMSRVRAVLWPSPGASQGYPEWRDLEAAGTGRSLYVPTGVPLPAPGTAAPAMRARWGVGDGVQAILLMGRPHAHKGYFRVLDWADHDRRRGDSRLVFVHAGQAPPPWTARDVSALRHVGYESDHAAAYLAADLVVFPNERAYMDIGLLECLALGGRLALSPVGGHADVARLCPEIPLIPDASPETAVSFLRSTCGFYERRPEMAGIFRALWEREFSPRPFVEAHAAAMRGLAATA